MSIEQGIKSLNWKNIRKATAFMVWPLLAMALVFANASAQAPANKHAAPPRPRRKNQRAATSHTDLSKTPTLYVVNYAHLDTEWRWEYPQTIQEYLTKTMRNNFALFQKYPHYVFNFTGANRYMFMKEYDPQDYAELKKYVAAGRWFPGRLFHGRK